MISLMINDTGLHELAGEMDVQVLCPLFNWVVCVVWLSCRRCLCILDARPLQDYDCKYHLLFFWVSFPFLDSELLVCQLFLLIKSNSWFFPCILSELHLRIPCQIHGYENWPQFSSKSFVLLTQRADASEYVFRHGTSEGSTRVILHVDVHSLPTDWSRPQMHASTSGLSVPHPMVRVRILCRYHNAILPKGS